MPLPLENVSTLKATKLSALAAIALLLAGCSPTPPPPAWKVETQLRQSQKFPIELNQVAPAPILAVGGSWDFKTSGVVALQGEDGKWTFHPPELSIDAMPYLLNDVSFPDVSTGWAAGDRGVVLRTTDSGKSWQQQRRGKIYEHLHGIFFTDLKQGCVAGPEGLFRTSDGGESWTRAARGDLFDVCFSDQQHGWAVGNYPAALQSSDGGASWRPLVLPGHRQYDWLVSVRFCDAQHGVVVGFNDGQQLGSLEPGDGAVIYQTEDGGLTWKRRGEDLPIRLTDVWFQDPVHGWVCGESRQGASQGVIYETQDGGESWKPVAVQLNGIPTCLNGGWGCTDKGEILRLNGSARK